MSAEQLQITIYDALTGDADLMALIEGVYDNPAQVENPGDNSAFPFVTVGDAAFSEWDTDTETGFEATVTVHTWSRAHHHMECKKVQDRIYAVLHRAELTITGFRFVGCDQALQDAQRDPDGITIHGVQQYVVRYDRVI